MLKKMTDLLALIGGEDPISSGVTASSLLELIESEGMSPPSISIPTKAIFGNKEINVGNITTIRVWETEDET
jgi:hypothetical protein